MTRPSVLLFSTLKPMSGPDAAIQRLAAASWARTGARVVLYGDDAGVDELADEFGFEHVPSIARRPNGIPTVDAVFAHARRLAPDACLVYVNSDIYVAGDLATAIELARARFDHFLLVARRTELRLEKPQVESLTADEVPALASTGRPAPIAALDLFVLDERTMLAPPPMSIGKVGWDGWMVYDARRRGAAVIDVSELVGVLHLDVEPGWSEGKVPPTDPETMRNRHLTGWAQLFTLRHVTHRVVGGAITRSRQTRLRSWVLTQTALTPGLRRVMGGRRMAPAQAPAGARPSAPRLGPDAVQPAARSQDGVRVRNQDQAGQHARQDSPSREGTRSTNRQRWEGASADGASRDGSVGEARDRARDATTSQRSGPPCRLRDATTGRPAPLARDRDRGR